MKLLAEIKKASPFSGRFREEIDPVAIVAEYEQIGASAISVVTAPSFEGKLEWIMQVRKVTNLPILQKDFITTKDQISFARDLGTDWLLFIANRFENADQLDEMCFYAIQAGIKPVVEVYDGKDLCKALKCDTHRILVNRRDLTTGELNSKNCEFHGKIIPDKYEIIAASGFDCNEQIESIKQYSYDWVLIGEAFMRSSNIEQTYKDLWQPKSLELIPSYQSVSNT